MIWLSYCFHKLYDLQTTPAAAWGREAKRRKHTWCSHPRLLVVICLSSLCFPVCEVKQLHALVRLVRVCICMQVLLRFPDMTSFPPINASYTCKLAAGNVLPLAFCLTVVELPRFFVEWVRLSHSINSWLLVLVTRYYTGTWEGPVNCTFHSKLKGLSVAERLELDTTRRNNSPRLILHHMHVKYPAALILCRIIMQIAEYSFDLPTSNEKLFCLSCCRLKTIRVV